MSSHHRLAFAEHEAIECNSLLEFSETTRRAVPKLIGYDAAEPHAFRSKASFASVNGLSLFAASLPNARTYARVGGCDENTFCFHLTGECAFEVERQTLRVRPATSAIFLPNDCPWLVEVSNPSTVVAAIKKTALESTVRTMLGSDVQESLISVLRNPSEISLEFMGLSFDAVFRLLFSQVDGYCGSQAMLDVSGIDDAFYRNLALAMLPGVFAQQSQRPLERVAPRQLDRVCQYVMAQLSHRITLTDLENVGHMSRRTLHNAFMRAFGLSPMAWVREQRLLAARHLLSRPSSTRSVTEVVFASGFASASQFSARYAERFGELPSVTLARSRGTI